jgi:hypothetical protein
MGSTNGEIGQSRPDFVFFTDFDGTITMQDSNDFLVG